MPKIEVEVSVVRFMFRFLSVFFLITASVPLFANPDLFYRQEIDKKIVQRLEWSQDDAALNFLVEIEKQEGSRWVQALQQTTEENFIEISLNHGQYRYRVTPSDLLGRRRPAAEWAQLSILQVFQPELDGLLPSIVYLDEAEQVILELSGSNFIDDSKVFLRSPQGNEITSDKYTVLDDGKKAQLEFNKSKLQAGLFDVVIENPGGLNDTLRNFRIMNNKESGGRLAKSNFNFYLSEGYAPFIAFPSLLNDFFGRSFFEAGAVLHFGWLPFTLGTGKLGLEFQPSYHYLSAPVSNSSYSEYEISAQFIEIRGNIVWNIPLFSRLALHFRAGGGITVLADVHLQDDVLSSPARSAWIPLAGGGAAFNIFIFTNFYLDIGADFIYVFSVDNPAPAYCMPYFALGFQF